MPRSPKPWWVAPCVLVALAAPPALSFEIAEYEKAIETIRCDCGCHPQSVKDCACGRAAEMRAEIHKLVAGDPATGTPALTAAQIIARYVERQGEQILIAPAAQGFNLVAWLGPLALLLFGSAGLMLLLRRWNLRRQVVSEPPTTTAPDPDDPYLRRLSRQLEELD